MAPYIDNMRALEILVECKKQDANIASEDIKH